MVLKARLVRSGAFMFLKYKLRPVDQNAESRKRHPLFRHMLAEKAKSTFRTLVFLLRFNLRKWSLASRMAPGFIIVGAQKAGTTSLYRYMTKHPLVKTALLKEIHYFDLNYGKSLKWYRSFFPSRRGNEGCITGEASPYYMFHPFSIRRIAENNPEMKIIVLLRNPVQRAISHYYHEFRKGREPLGLKEALEAESRRLEPEIKSFRDNEFYRGYHHQRHAYVSRGIYVDQILEIYKYFDHSNLLVLDSNEFFGNPGKVLKEVFEFLGVNSDIKVATAKSFNVGKKVRDPDENEVKGKLKEFYKEHNARLFDVLGRTFQW